MIVAKEFSRSAVARRSDFSTSTEERGVFTLMERGNSARNLRQRVVRGSVVAQFAASDSGHFADAAELIYPFVDGIDLNCGKYPLISTAQAEILSRQAVRKGGLIRSTLDRFCSANLTRGSFASIGNGTDPTGGRSARVRDIIKSARDRVGANYPISIKIRVDPDLK